ncbi:MAG TPA: hypothetical protein VIS74_02550 [Chthoniobacterales bacterium]
MPAAKKKTQTAAPKKAAPKTTAQKKAAAVRSSPEEKLATNALKWIDEAADLLRKGVNTTASSSAKARFEAKQKAHTLLTKAHGTLSQALTDGTSLLQKAIKKLP